MGKVAWVYPGQGSQVVGMGRDVIEAVPETKDYFRVAQATLGYDLAQLCFEGPADKLTETVFTQPAVLTVSTVLTHVLSAHGMTPDYVAGHSLGEYSALVASGSLSFSQGVGLVSRRAKLMEQAVPRGEGAMAVLLGLGGPEVAAICQEAAGGDVLELANMNGPGQIVISGSSSAVGRALVLGRARGARRAVELAVSGPFHSSLMQPVSRQFAPLLTGIPWRQPQMPLVANVTADYIAGAAQIPQLLTEQLYRAVRWEETVRRLVADGVGTFIEVGPGRVLAGLIRRISRSSRVLNFQGMSDLEKILEIVKGDIII